MDGCDCVTENSILEYNRWLHKLSVANESIGTMPALLSPPGSNRPVTPETHFSDNIPFKRSPNELVWTKVNETGTTVFSAYFEDRGVWYAPSVVVLGYQSKQHRNSSLYCLYRYKDGSVECSSEATVIFEMDACDKQKEYDRKKERKYLHVFHVCILGSGEELPTHVALSYKRPCVTSTAFIPVFQHRPATKKDFGVCVQTPAFQKTLPEIVNFIEMYRFLGAQKFTLYVLHIDLSVQTHLKSIYGEMLEIIQWTTHLHEKEPIHYYGEILAIQDCLYRNMYSIKYLAFVDLDEVIVPKRYSNWRTMLQEIDRPYIDSFIFANSIYMPSNLPKKTIAMLKNMSVCEKNPLPSYFTYLDHAKCAFHYFSRSKLIVKPNLIFDTSIHGVCTRIGDTTHHFVPISSATSHHYRKTPTIECRKNRRTRKYATEYDDWMLRYSSKLFSSTSAVLCGLNL